MGRRYTPEELKGILDNHRKWLREEPGGSRADLADANLARANLTDAYLTGADLTGAYLADANLTGADLADADLTGAYLADANLAGANLADADLTGAYLADANLAGANLADADLTGADLTGAYLTEDPIEPYARTSSMNAATRENRISRYRARHPEVPVVERLDARILDAITVGGGKLEMGQWHACATTHCRAGWAVTLAGDAGKKLEKEYGPALAGAMIYRASTGRAPHFYASNEDALEDIKRCAAEQTAESAP